MMINDCMSAVLAFLGLFFTFYEVELFYGELDWEDQDGTLTYKVEEEQYVERPGNTVLRVLTGITSVILAGLVIRHWYILLALNKAKHKLDFEETLRSSGMHLPMIIEVCYVLIHCPPGVNFVFETE
jgi:succinate dehydrogenase hydrophobic anchor subunit